jgi:hypothetical protein
LAAAGADDTLETPQRPIQNVLEQEHQGIQGLILGTRGRVPLDSQMDQKLRHLLRTHRSQVLVVVEPDEIADPVAKRRDF